MSNEYDYSLTGNNTLLHSPFQESTPNYFNPSFSDTGYKPSYDLSNPSYFSFNPSPMDNNLSFDSSPSNTSLSQLYNQSPAPLPDNFITRQPDQYSGGDYEIDPVTGERKEDGGFLSKLRNFSMPEVSQGQADLFKGLAGLYSAYQGRNQASQLRQAAQQQDPFGPQRAQYQQLLSQSYSNPNAFMATPEARMQQDALRQQLERLDAKSGRRSQYGSRAVQLAQAQAKQLADYRTALQQPAGSGINPSMAGQLQSQAAQTEMTAGGAPFQALSDIFTGQTPQYKAQAEENKKLRDSIALLTK